MLSRKVGAAAVAALALGAAGGLAVAAAVGGSPNVPVPPDKGAALGRLASVATTDSNTEPASTASFEPQPIPGRMLGPEVPVPVSPSMLDAQNGWLASDGKSLVAVYAGAAGNDPSVGRVVIVRQDLVAGRQTVQTVDAAETGNLTIASAPLGTSAETLVQTATIRLRTADGRALTLDLATDGLGSG
ncbi:MAG: hypothetical protein ACJ75G_09655 [Gaiellaceae bacterium]